MEHFSVLLNESIDALNIKPAGVYVDGTLGRGGHSLEIVKRLDTGRLIAIDRDIEAINETSVFTAEQMGKIDFVHGNFRDVTSILDSMDINEIDGLILDLGVSSPQLDNAGRGFSYMNDADLDMRMDTDDELTALEIVNSWSKEELRKIFYEYGEERYAGRIADRITKTRTNRQIKTTFDLNEIIIAAIPSVARKEPQHPSKRCFQALRIAVNDELGALAQTLETIPERLRTGSRICIISFHSLEEKIVKKAFKMREKGCICPPGLPVCGCGFIPTMKVITKKPIISSEQERESNPRARSAKLRVAEKI